MKINTLLSMVKKRKNCIIHYDSRTERQWMQLGGNLYPLDGMPYIDKETLLVMMDVPEDKWDGYWIQCQTLPEKLIPLVADNAEGDKLARKAYLKIAPFEEALCPVYVDEESEKLVLTPAVSYKPIADDEEEYTLFSREANDRTWIVAKKGFELIAVISRVVVHDEQTEKVLVDVLTHIRADAARIKAEEAARDGEQQHI